MKKEASATTEKPKVYKADQQERFLKLIEAAKCGEPLNRHDYSRASVQINRSEDTYERDMRKLKELAEALDSPHFRRIDKKAMLHYQLKMPDISENEYLVLTLLHQIGLGLFRNEDIRHPALVSIANTLANAYVDKEKSPYLELLDHIKYRYSEAYREKDSLSKIIYIMQSIKDRKMLKCEYQKPQVKESKSILLKPARLFFYNGSWYVIGEEDRSEKVKQYKVSRMSKIGLTETKYTINTKKINKVLNKLDSSFGIHFDPQAEVQIAKIKFDNEVKDLMQDLVWFDKQENNEKFADGVIFKVPYTASRELLGRILRYGCHAEVLEPEDLKLEWLSEIRKMAERFI